MFEVPWNYQCQLAGRQISRQEKTHIWCFFLLLIFLSLRSLAHFLSRFFFLTWHSKYWVMCFPEITVFEPSTKQSRHPTMAPQKVVSPLKISCQATAEEALWTRMHWLSENSHCQQTPSCYIDRYYTQVDSVTLFTSLSQTWTVGVQARCMST